jgi:hypothetical protein
MEKTVTVRERPSTSDHPVAGHRRGARALEFGRRLGLGLLAGAVAGLVAGGIGGRLVMLVLARLNPRATGVLSDDGFVMGQFTLAGTLNLLLVATVMGAIGGLVWVAIRGLRFGPRWWRTVSMPLGATVVIGSMMVHSDGIDFTLLEPAWLAVVLTLSVPLVATILVTMLGDRWIGSDRTTWQRMPTAILWIARAALTVLAVVSVLELSTVLNQILAAAAVVGQTSALATCPFDQSV